MPSITTLPVPFGVRAMFPFVSVDVMALPSSCRLSTLIVPSDDDPALRSARCYLNSRIALLTPDGDIPSSILTPPTSVFDAAVEL